MAARRKNGLFASPAVTEAARRQLMAQVPSWELKWVVPDSVTPGSPLKVYRWVKTDKVQQFSDDEGEADDPLAPLPDEPDVPDPEEDEQEDDQTKLDSQMQSRELSEVPSRIRPSEAPDPVDRSPKSHPLATSLVLDTDDNEQAVAVPDIVLDPLGPSEAPHLEPLNEEDLGVLGLPPGLTNPDPASFDLQDGLNIVDTDTVMKNVTEDTLGA